MREKFFEVRDERGTSTRILHRTGVHASLHRRQMNVRSGTPSPSTMKPTGGQAITCWLLLFWEAAEESINPDAPDNCECRRIRHHRHDRVAPEDTLRLATTTSLESGTIPEDLLRMRCHQYLNMPLSNDLRTCAINVRTARIGARFGSSISTVPFAGWLLSARSQRREACRRTGPQD